MGTLARIVCPPCDESVDRAAPPAACPRCRGVLEAEVDLGAVTPGLGAEIRRRPRGLWRGREFLPIADQDAVVTLGEGDTTVTGHGLKQPGRAAARAEPLLTIDPSLSELERHLRRNPL